MTSQPTPAAGTPASTGPPASRRREVRRDTCVSVRRGTGEIFYYNSGLEIPKKFPMTNMRIFNKLLKSSENVRIIMPRSLSSLIVLLKLKFDVPYLIVNSESLTSTIILFIL